MSTFSATPALGRVVGVTARRWRRLTASLFDPYRPKLHYMRGPAQNGAASMNGHYASILASYR
jgi:hypothetical protein